MEDDDDAASAGSVAMPDDRPLVERFEEERPRLLRLAHGMLANLFDADEAIQDTWMMVREPWSCSAW